MEICVFGSSSKKTRKEYTAEAYKLGELIAESGNICVNGAGRFGCMGGVNDGCKSKNGRIKGIIHRQFCVDFKEHPVIEDLLIVDGEDLTIRKHELFNHSDCLIVLPGGCGTFDEMWEAVSYSSLGMRGMAHKPICVLNVEGFYDGFIRQMHRAYHDGILYHEVEEYFHVASSAEEALTWSIDTARKLQAQAAQPGGKNAKLERVIARSTTVNETSEVDQNGSGSSQNTDASVGTNSKWNIEDDAASAKEPFISSGKSNDWNNNSSARRQSCVCTEKIWIPTTVFVAGLSVGFVLSRYFK